MTTLQIALLCPLFALWGYGIASSLLHIWQRHRERRGGSYSIHNGSYTK